MFFAGARSGGRSSPGLARWRWSRRSGAALLLAFAACSAAVDDISPGVDGQGLPDGVVGVPYSATLSASGTRPLVWSQENGSLPTGLALTSEGTILGTPSAVGTFAFTVRASNALGADTADYTIAVALPPTAPTITGPALPLADATVGQAHSLQFSATGTAPIQWSIASGALPAGLTMDFGSGLVAGTPTTAGVATFTVAADNALGTATLACTLAVLAVPTAPAITGPASPLAAGVVHVAYTATFLATGTAPISWSVSAGSLPSGLSLDAGTGVLSGTPVVAAVHAFSITATNGLGADTQAFQLTTGYAPSLSSLAPTSGVVGGTVRLLGAGFAPSTVGNTVHFGAAAATVLAATATELTVAVPSGIGTSEPVTVTTGAATTSAQTFTRDAASVVFVDGAAAAGGDGSSWAAAFDTLQEALAVATSGQEIWIAAGTYRPGPATTDWFGVASQHVYGGFAATEALRSQRVALAHATVLSGDVAGDGVGLTNLADNNQHVVMTTGNCTLDGLRITQGNSPSSGGGIHASAGALILRDVELYENRAAGDGGGLFASDVVLSIVDCTIRDNVAAASGGGVAIEHGSTASLGSLSRVAIARNTAAFHGGGVYDTELVSYVNCVFAGNAATLDGGGLYRTAYAVGVTFATFVGNSADRGGGFYGKGTLTNALFWNNSAVTAGADVATYGDTTLSHCVVATAVAGVGTLTQQAVSTGDPLLVGAGDADGADDRFRTADDGLRIDAGGSAHDAGTAVLVVTDVLGAARPAGAAMDIGAYERQ